MCTGRQQLGKKRATADKLNRHSLTLRDRYRYFAAILAEIITSKGNVETRKAEVLKRRADSACYSLLSMSRPFEQQVRQLSDGSFQDAKCPGAPTSPACYQPPADSS